MIRATAQGQHPEEISVSKQSSAQFSLIHGINDDTVTLGRCQRSLPLFAKMNPAPEVHRISLGAGIHSWGWTDDKLSQGIVPSVAKLWHDAIMNGFFIP